jgi:pimeloyl-ACP methyl ester carboxylesterase
LLPLLRVPVQKRDFQPERTMFTLSRLTLLVAAALAFPSAAILSYPRLLPAQSTGPMSAVVVDGTGAETFVLVSGMIGGVTGFRHLEKLLVERGYRVIVIDPYLLSLDSAEVTFAALARRVDAVLAANHVTSARVVAHSHGAGVMLRVAAMSPLRVASLYFLDAGAIPENRGPMLSGAMRLVPVITRLPGGRRLVRGRLVSELHKSTGRQEWLDADAERRYSEPVLDCIDRVIAMAGRLANAQEPESLATVVARVHVPVTVLLGDAPHTAGAGAEEIDALAPLGALLHIEHLTGIGHFPHEEAPNDLMRHLLPAPAVALTHSAAGGGVQ